MAVAFPDSILVTTNRPTDAKVSVLTMAERDALPVSLRYKSMIIATRNPLGQRATWWCLPTDDLTNNGWVEIHFDGAVTITIDDWMPNTVYLLNQPVVFEGKLYRAEVAHTSSLSFDETNWQVIGGGGDGSSYIHTQDITSNTWTCVHNLGSIGVSVVIIESDGNEVIGYVDRAASTANTLIIRFSETISGRAFIKS
jgi:hypothetical protein